MIYDGTHKAHISGHSLLEISKIRGIWDILGPDSVPDGCTSSIFTLRGAKYYMVVSKKYFCFMTHIRHIYSVDNM